MILEAQQHAIPLLRYAVQTAACLLDPFSTEREQLLPPALSGSHQPGVLQHGKMLAHGLARHRDACAQLADRLVATMAQALDED